MTSKNRLVEEARYSLSFLVEWRGLTGRGSKRNFQSSKDPLRRCRCRKGLSSRYHCRPWLIHNGGQWGTSKWYSRRRITPWGSPGDPTWPKCCGDVGPFCSRCSGVRHLTETSREVLPWDSPPDFVRGHFRIGRSTVRMNLLPKRRRSLKEHRMSYIL